MVRHLAHRQDALGPRRSSVMARPHGVLQPTGRATTDAAQQRAHHHERPDPIPGLVAASQPVMHPQHCLQQQLQQWRDHRACQAPPPDRHFPHKASFRCTAHATANPAWQAGYGALSGHVRQLGRSRIQAGLAHCEPGQLSAHCWRNVDAFDCARRNAIGHLVQAFGTRNRVDQERQ